MKEKNKEQCEVNNKENNKVNNKLIINTPQTHPCSNPSCVNIHSIKCENKMCKTCCNGIGCSIHKRSYKNIR